MSILTICDNGDFLKIYRYLKIIVQIIKIAVPIVLILSLMIGYTRAAASKDDDALSRANKAAAAKAIAAVLIFFIPTFVNLIIDITSVDSSEIAKCSNNATKEGIEAAYKKEITLLVARAKETLTRGDYNAAKSRLSKLQSEEDKKEFAGQLDEILEEIKEKEEKLVKKQENGWWWPVGSSQTTSVGGKLFATGTPSATRITATFGGNDSVHRGLGGGHGAIDIGASRKSNIIATRSGVVVSPKAGERIDYPEQAIRPDADGNYNCKGLHSNTVKIDHGDGYTSSYGHLYMNTITVRAGDVVEQGQVIGLSGSSGCSTGPHLHFQVELNGTRVDPLNFVSASNPRP